MWHYARRLPRCGAMARRRTLRIRPTGGTYRQQSFPERRGHLPGRRPEDALKITNTRANRPWTDPLGRAGTKLTCAFIFILTMKFHFCRNGIIFTAETRRRRNAEKEFPAETHIRNRNQIPIRKSDRPLTIQVARTKRPAKTTQSPPRRHAPSTTLCVSAPLR